MCLRSYRILFELVKYIMNELVDWLISEHESVNPSKEAISVLSGKYKKLTFFHLVSKALLN